MRFLLDANLSPRLVVLLSEAGYDAVHVGELHLLSAPDPVTFDRAAADGYVLITADTDFSMLLALKEAALPSVILLRRVSELSPEEHAQLLVSNVPALTADLDRGVIVSLSPARLGGRRLDPLPENCRELVEFGHDVLTYHGHAGPATSHRVLGGDHLRCVGSASVSFLVRNAPAPPMRSTDAIPPPPESGHRR
ncbi:MAG: DUF5615 family PIN-like protein [Actinomycetota bacterium]